MYSYEERMKAVRIYMQYDHRATAAMRKLGYPTRKSLREWHREFLESGDLHKKYNESSGYSDDQKRQAVIELCSREASAASVADAFGVSRVSLYKWKHALLGDEGRPSMKDHEESPSSDDREDLQREVESLSKRIHRLQLEHDILKKANELPKKTRASTRKS